jgi:transcriptional regulator with XRE-family HTH domain
MHPRRKSKVARSANDRVAGYAHNVVVTTRPPHYIREWRKYRELTQERLGERIGRDKSIISKLENDRIDYSGEHLELIGAALGCEPRDLLDLPPNRTEAEVIDLLRRLHGEKKKAAIAMLKGLLEAG